MTALEALARRMYTERAAERGPRWEQLGDVTRSVWLGYAQAVLDAELYGDLA